MENTDVHIRYPSWSSIFWDKLIELGFREDGSDFASVGLKQVKRFKKPNLLIEDSFQGVYLYQINPKGEKTLKYSGKSLDSELLKNFSKKGIYNV